jgi:signal transduction histidine kinase
MRLPTMKISRQVFIAYVGLSVLLGAATLAAGYYSLQTLVQGIVKEDARILARELGLFMLPHGAGSFESMRETDRRELQEQIHIYTLRSDRIASLQIISTEGKILFADDRRRAGGQIVGREELEHVRSDEPWIRQVPDGASFVYEITVPMPAGPKGRLGTLRVRIRPKFFTTYLDEPRQRFIWIFVILVAVITVSGVVVASLFSAPVRRLNRALIELQTKHFRGTTLEEGSDVSTALRAVSQMGERIGALAQGARRQEIALSSLSRALDEGVAILDATGRVVTANPAAAAILQRPPAEDPVPAVAKVLEADRALALLVEQTLRTEQEVHGLDREVALPEGGRVGVRLSTYLLRDPDRPAGVLLVLRDLGSIRTFEQDLQEASRLSVLARLTASVAHEIKNPLNSMVINMEVLRGILASLPAEVKAESERYVQVVTDEIYRLDEVIRDFLGLTTASDLGMKTTDVNVLIRKVGDLIRYEAHTARVRIDYDLDGALPAVPAIPVRLTQAFLNLSLNAIQAMTEGGTLTIRSRIEDGAVRVDFRDTGPGIPPEIRERIFDFHFTTKPSGTGLGLSITRLILEAQGGTIRFETPEAGGAIFSVLLPAAAPVAAGG